MFYQKFPGFIATFSAFALTSNLVACSEADSGDSMGDAVASGGSSSGGSSSGGAAMSTGGATTEGAGGSSTSSGGAATGGATSSGGSDTGGDGSGGAGTGGEGSGGDSGNGEFVPSTGEPRTMGYLGCSMSVNVAEGYEALGGERLWPPIGQYNGQVVQNWANNNDAVWGAFENAVSQHGQPEDVWVMLCIFDNMVTVDEAKQIVANVRSRVPDANIYITGQPVYDDPNSCFLAGNGGPDKTDRIAEETASDASLKLVYPGALGPLSSGDSSDGCHTNAQGAQKLGAQFIEWFGD